LITKIGEQRAGILQRRGSPDAMFRKPIQIGSRNRPGWFYEGLQHDDWAAMPRDHDLLTFEGTINQSRKSVVGFGNTVRAHTPDIAI
jgi:hypothetical protein